jgi:hypothetical protein
MRSLLLFPSKTRQSRVKKDALNPLLFLVTLEGANGYEISL